MEYASGTDPLEKDKAPGPDKSESETQAFFNDSTNILKIDSDPKAQKPLPGLVLTPDGPEAKSYKTSQDGLVPATGDSPKVDGRQEQGAKDLGIAGKSDSGYGRDIAYGYTDSSSSRQGYSKEQGVLSYQGSGKYPLPEDKVQLGNEISSTLRTTKLQEDIFSKNLRATEYVSQSSSYEKKRVDENFVQYTVPEMKKIAEAQAQYSNPEYRTAYAVDEKFSRMTTGPNAMDGKLGFASYEKEPTYGANGYDPQVRFVADRGTSYGSRGAYGSGEAPSKDLSQGGRNDVYFGKNNGEYFAPATKEYGYSYAEPTGSKGFYGPKEQGFYTPNIDSKLKFLEESGGRSTRTYGDEPNSYVKTTLGPDKYAYPDKTMQDWSTGYRLPKPDSDYWVNDKVNRTYDMARAAYDPGSDKLKDYYRDATYSKLDYHTPSERIRPAEVDYGRPDVYRSPYFDSLDQSKLSAQKMLDSAIRPADMRSVDAGPGQFRSETTSHFAGKFESPLPVKTESTLYQRQDAPLPSRHDTQMASTVEPARTERLQLAEPYHSSRIEPLVGHNRETQPVRSEVAQQPRIESPAPTRTDSGPLPSDSVTSIDYAHSATKGNQPVAPAAAADRSSLTVSQQPMADRSFMRSVVAEATATESARKALDGSGTHIAARADATTLVRSELTGQKLDAAGKPILEGARLEGVKPENGIRVDQLPAGKVVDVSQTSKDGARFVVEMARALEGTRLSVDATRVPAESGRVAGDGIRVSVEGGRVVAEGVRVANDGGRVVPEGVRVATDGGRVVPEGVRVATEGGRVVPEGVRVATEGGRVVPEGVRVATEGGRVVPEGVRVGAEGGRVVPEGVRVGAEGGRVVPEGVRINAEGGRVVPEGVRINAEGGRGDLPGIRVAGIRGESDLTGGRIPVELQGTRIPSGRTDIDGLGGRRGTFVDGQFVPEDGDESDPKLKKGVLRPSREINGKRYLTGVEVALGALLIGAATARNREQDGELPGLEILGSEEVSDPASKLDQQTVLRRRTYMVQEGDTLESIAEHHYKDKGLAWLIADLNLGSTKETVMDGKRIVEFKCRQLIELPAAQDIEEWRKQSRTTDGVETLVTIVSESAVDHELLQSFLATVSGQTPSQPAPATPPAAASASQAQEHAPEPASAGIPAFGFGREAAAFLSTGKLPLFARFIAPRRAAKPASGT